MSIPISSWPTEPGARAQRLADALPSERLSLLRTVAAEAAARRMPIYIVGGFVRDLLLGYPATDFDLVVEGDAIAFARGLAEKHGGKVTAHTRFGTAQWFLPESLVIRRGASGTPDSLLSTLDLISARSESYVHPGALPKVKLGTLTDDLRRRDFTVNTLALRLDGDYFGELRDDLGGLEDLRRGQIRVLHPRSFVDDPTRIFRAVRYEQRYGFRITPETLVLIPEARLWIARLSAERLRHELDLILEEDTAAAVLARLAELKVLVEVHPALTWKQSIHRRIERDRGVPAIERRAFGWMLWLMHLPVTMLEQMDSRLHFHATLRENIFSASALYADLRSLANKKPSQCVAILEDFPLVSVRAVYLAALKGEARKNLGLYLETWRHIRPSTTGYTLKKLGLEPGPKYKEILLRLRNAWLDGMISSAAEEKSYLKKLL